MPLLCLSKTGATHAGMHNDKTLLLSVPLLVTFPWAKCRNAATDSQVEGSWQDELRKGVSLWDVHTLHGLATQPVQSGVY